MYFCKHNVYKNKTRQLDKSEATGNQHYKDNVFSCYNQVNGRILCNIQNLNEFYLPNECRDINILTFQTDCRNGIRCMEIYVFCFRLHASEIDTSYIVNEYQKIQTLFSWMGIDSRSMLYGLDHVQSVCSKINALK